MKKAFCITTLFILLAAFQCRAQTQSNNAPLTNKDVIELLKMGLSPDVIVAKIKNSSSNFDTSPAALQELKTANAPEAVILAMVQAPSPTNQASATLSEKPAPKTGVKNLYEVPRRANAFVTSTITIGTTAASKITAQSTRLGGTRSSTRASGVKYTASNCNPIIDPAAIQM
jgi:hypothetical protein